MQPFYKRMWFIVLMLVLFAPLGIALLWLFGSQTKNTKIVLTTIFGIFFLVVATSGGNKGERTTLLNNSGTALETAGSWLSTTTGSPVMSETPALQVTAAVLASTAETATESPAESATAAATEATAEPSPSPTAVPRTYTITVVVSKGKLISNDHVGSSWSSSATVNDAAVAFGKTKTLKLADNESFTIVCSATESDKRPDEGSDFFEVKVSDLKAGKNTFTRDVIVSENGGRYSGHEAVWRFQITITKKLTK